mgnify:CR=1 FL=1
MIKINKPYIQEENGYARLCSKIEVDSDVWDIWYEVEACNKQYLCYEKADAFLIGLLPFAMAFNHNIKVIDCPISEKIYWNLINTFIPALSKYSNYYKFIEIDTDISNQKFDSFAVATGFSGGVDSFYTYLKNKQKNTKDFNITHLTFFNVGACGSYGGAEAEKRFYERIKSFESFVASQKLDFVKINSNISEHVMMSYNFTHSFRSMSAVLALQKLFKTYYYSADYTLNEFSFDPYDSSFYDLLNVQCFSTENTTIYTTGAVETRLEKVEYISEYPETYNVLNVCNTNDHNCRTCEKCIRTMADLYSINALGKYSAVFDVEYFKKHLVHNIAFVISKAKDGTVEALYFKEIVTKMKQNKIKIPVASYFVAIPLTIKFIIINIARKSKFLKKMWHKHMSKDKGIRYNDI